MPSFLLSLGSIGTNAKLVTNPTAFIHPAPHLTGAKSAKTDQAAAPSSPHASPTAPADVQTTTATAGSEQPQPAGVLESRDGVKPRDEDEFEFRPAHFFFYGSLMDHDILARVVGLHRSEYPPKMRDATVRGFKMKIWSGEYPVLVPANDCGLPRSSNTPGRVAALANSVSCVTLSPPNDGLASGSTNAEHEEVITGRLWLATDFEQALRLQRYETAAYEACDCLVRLEDGSGELVRAVTFRWAGNPDDPNLEPGSFDLAEYQRTTKPRLLGPDDDDAGP